MCTLQNNNINNAKRNAIYIMTMLGIDVTKIILLSVWYTINRVSINKELLFPRPSLWSICGSRGGVCRGTWRHERTSRWGGDGKIELIGSSGEIESLRRRIALLWSGKVSLGVHQTTKLWGGESIRLSIICGIERESTIALAVLSRVHSTTSIERERTTSTIPILRLPRSKVDISLRT